MKELIMSDKRKYGTRYIKKAEREILQQENPDISYSAIKKLKFGTVTGKCCNCEAGLNKSSIKIDGTWKHVDRNGDPLCSPCWKKITPEGRAYNAEKQRKSREKRMALNPVQEKKKVGRPRKKPVV